MFFSLPNELSFVAYPTVKPWKQAAPPPDSITTKADYVRWCADPATKYVFVSGVEGMSPEVRVSADNPPARMHGLVVDYDAKSLDLDFLRKLGNRPPAPYPPMAGTISFSGGCKLFWEFEEPLPMGNQELLNAFCTFLVKKLALKKWAPGFDEKAITKGSVNYMAVGTEAYEFPNASLVPAPLLRAWLYECFSKTRLGPDQNVKIPIEEVAAEVESQYPGRWKGPFDVGASGVRFWDPQADNPRGAQVREDGMMAYSGEQAFIPWRKILGEAFVARFVQDKVSQIIENTVYDGKQYYAKEIRANGEVEWRKETKEDLTQRLKVLGFSSRAAKGSTFSEIDAAEVAVRRHNTVDYAFPLINYDSGIVSWRGRKLLALGSPKPISPASLPGVKATYQELMERAPFVGNLLDGLFLGRKNTDGFLPVDYFLAWLKHWYCSSRHIQGGLPGQAIILVGPPGRGKSLLCEGILGRLMGGCVEGTSFLVEGSRWTDIIASSPLVYVGDGSATATNATILQFTNLIKKHIANSSMHAAVKFGNEMDVPWNGRFFITANEDEESLRILPNAEIGSLDKMSFFRASRRDIKFPARPVIEKLVAQDLPILAWFLEEWEPPEALYDPSSRFGAVCYHSPSLLAEAYNHGTSGALQEMLRDFIRAWEAGNPGKEYFEGSASALKTAMEEHNRQVAVEYKTLRSFQTAIGQLASRGIMNVQYYFRDKKTRERAVRVWYDLDNPDLLRSIKEEDKKWQMWE